jgi:Uma2 family endonuclease
LTAAEYLALERTAEFKSEFLNGEMFAMAGASPEHNAIKDNTIGELFAQLKGSSCRSYSSDQRVRVDRTGLCTYPDILIVCGPAAFDPEDRMTLLNPQVIFEILSESTESYDRGVKFRHYQQLPSVQEYVLVAPDRMQVDRFVRQPNGTWVLTVFADPNVEFSLTTIPVRFPLAAMYAGVALTEPPAGRSCWRAMDQEH